jgi:hypothetical protein
MLSRSPRLALSTGLALSLGLAFMPLGCGTLEEPAYTPARSLHDNRHANRHDDREVPEGVVKQLTACANQAPAGSTSSEPATHAIQFHVQATASGRIDAVSVKGSTLSDPDLEACMADALEGMTLPLQDLALRVSASAPRRPLAPESRGLVANTLPLFGPFSLAPLVITGAAFILVVAIIVYVTSEPVAKATRRRPNQTCDNDELKELEQKKERLCNSGYETNCRPEKGRLGRIPCSAIMLSLAQRLLCLRQRNLIQDKCFGGVPDDGHREAIENAERGINHCEALKLTNCAKGHPMSGL